MSNVNQMLNLYQHIDKKYQNKVQDYATRKEIQIDIPMRLLVIGAAGSGKTNAVVNLVIKMSAWNKIFLVAKNVDQPLYRFMIDKLRKIEKEKKVQILYVTDNLSECPSVEHLDKKNNKQSCLSLLSY